MSYFTLIFTLGFLFGCPIENDQSVEGLYVIRYSKSDLDKHFNRKDEIPIDFEKIDFFVPRFEGESLQKIASLIVNEDLLIRDNNLFQLPSSDISSQLSYFAKSQIDCSTQVNIQDSLNERNLFSSGEESKYLYALYRLNGSVYQLELENSAKTNLILNPVLKVSNNHEYINCFFICEVYSISPFIPSDESIKVYR